MTPFGTWLANCVRASSSSLLFCIQPSLKLLQLLYLGLLVFPFISCLQNLHFSMIILPPNIRIFPVFLQLLQQISQQIEVYTFIVSLQLDVFMLRGFIFCDIHQKQGRSSSNSGYKMQKKSGWKIYSCMCTFGAEVHKLNIRDKRQHNKYENSELD